MLSEGELVGDFSLSDQHGNTVTLDDLVENWSAGIVLLPENYDPSLNQGKLQFPRLEVGVR